MAVTSGTPNRERKQNIPRTWLVYAFNLTIKENKFSFYFYFGGKEDVLSVCNVGGGSTEFHTLVISYGFFQLLTKERSWDSHLPSARLSKARSLLGKNVSPQMLVVL